MDDTAIADTAVNTVVDDTAELAKPQPPQLVKTQVIGIDDNAPQCLTDCLDLQLSQD